MLDHSAKIAKESEAADLEVVETATKQALEEWIDAINRGNPDSINALYMNNAVLIATFAPVPQLTAGDRKDYFAMLKKRTKLKTIVNECRLQAIDTHTGVANGIYTFSFFNDEGAHETIRARFTFVFARQPEGDWLIAAHHSSVVPG